MHAMQYRITLPADYDMGVIRHRVATRGHLLDDFPGLGLKAYLMRVRGGDSPVNQYAPFYLWTRPEGMNAFLWGSGFQGVVQDFGRPAVRHWAGLSYEEGPASSALARSATLHRSPVPASASPADAVEAAVEESRRLAKSPGAVASASAADPHHWELLHFTLWDHDAPAAPGERFQVLHLSHPEQDRIRRGRQW
ncbi:DUF4865 family protein [Streptomyces sp. SID9727]|uniref:DUF4865 family protein n=1 Tax=Streptomyces sp. SID9727 TaxID=2706114 RepID=UPI0013CAD10D|nr:DUF4865 family protein [Streptomyces sp. SID9727]NEC63655.1 DUF4865 family protein [Streptomyces sp. SID9727]